MMVPTQWLAHRLTDNLPDNERTPGPDMRLPGEAFCSDCPDHEACATAYPCDVVRRMADTLADTRPPAG